MASCDIQTLADSAACFNTLTAGQREVILLQLLCNIWSNLDPVASCNIQDLMDDAKCFNTLMAGQRGVIMLQLLCEINTTLQPLCGDGSPEGVVTGLFCGQTYNDIDPTSPTYQAQYRFLGTPGANTGWV